MATLFFTVAAVVGGGILRLQILDNPFDIKAVFGDFAAFSLFASLAFLFRSGRRAYYYIGVILFFAIITVGNAVYYRSHESMLSLFLLPQFNLLGPVADAGLSLLEWTDLLHLLNVIGLSVVVLRLKRKGYFDGSRELAGLRKRKAFTCLMLFVVIFGVFAVALTRTEASRLRKQWNRPYLVERFGLYGYHLSDMFKYLGSAVSLSNISNEEVIGIAKYYAERNHQTVSSNEYTGLLAGQNLVIIHAESVQGLFMFENVKGQEIVPNLNRIARGGLYFNNFYSQQSVGTSSDTEFTFNTSLFPIHDGTVFITHFDRHFVSLPSKLRDQGYSTIAMHGNNGTFWNRETMNRTLGYQRFYSKKDFVVDDCIGMGLSDMSFFRQSLEIIESTPQPFYTTLIMLTNHTPFAEVDKYGPFDTGQFEGSRFGRYLKSLHYTDRAIGYLFDALEARGMLDNTAIVIYGDHPANLARSKVKEFLGTKKLDRFDFHRLNKVPLIIWSKRIAQPRVYDTPMGMIDVFPTMAAMLDVENPYALGRNIFDSQSNYVTFPNGSWLDNNVHFDSSRMKYKLINEDYVRMLQASCLADIGADLSKCTSKKRVFSYTPGRRGKSGLSRYTYGYVHQRTVVSAKAIDVSYQIVEHDLLRPGKMDHALASVTPTTRKEPPPPSHTVDQISERKPIGVQGVHVGASLKE